MKKYVIFILILISTNSVYTSDTQEKVDAYIKQNGYNYPWELSGNFKDKDSFLIMSYIHLGEAHINVIETDSSIYYFNQALKIAKRKHRNEFLGQIFTAYGSYWGWKEDFQKALIYNYDAESYALKYDNQKSLSLIYTNTALIWAYLEDYENFLEYFNKAIKINETYGKHLNNVHLWFEMANYRLHHNDSLEVLEAANQMIKSGFRTEIDLWVAYAKNNYVGFALDLNELDSAKIYIDFIKSASESFEYKWLKQNIFKNLSLYYIEKYELDSASFYLQKSRSASTNSVSIIEAEFNFIEAKILYLKNKMQKALNYLKKIQLDSLKISRKELGTKVFDLYSKIYEKQGNSDLAQISKKRYYDYLDSLNNSENKDNMLLLETKLKLKQKEIETERLEKQTEIEEEKNEKLYIFIIALVLLLTVISIFFIFRYIKNKKILAMKEEVNIAKTKNLKLLLNEKESNLKELTAKLSKQIEKYDLLKEEFEKNINNQKSDVNLNELVSKIKEDYKNKEYWSEFELKFLEIYPNFFDTLKTKYPSLSPSELKVLSFIKMNFNSKEIANVFGIEATSINRHRSNIRKKANLDRSKDLLEFLTELGL